MTILIGKSVVNKAKLERGKQRGARQRSQAVLVRNLADRLEREVKQRQPIKGLAKRLWDVGIKTS